MKKLIAVATAVLLSISLAPAQAFDVSTPLTQGNLVAPASGVYYDYARAFNMTGNTVVALFIDGPKVYTAVSSDNGSTWGPTTLVRDFINTNGASQYFQLSPTRLVITNNPIPLNKFQATYGDLVNGQMVWQEPVDVTFTDSVTRFVEVNFSSNENGVTHMVATTGDYSSYQNKRELIVKQSSDGGITWTELPEIISFADSRHINNPQILTMADGTPVVVAEEQLMTEIFNVTGDRRLVGYYFQDGIWKFINFQGGSVFTRQDFGQINAQIVKTKNGTAFAAAYGFFGGETNFMAVENLGGTPTVSNSVLPVGERVIDAITDSDGTVHVLTVGGCPEIWGYCPKVNVTSSVDNGQNWTTQTLQTANAETSKGYSFPTITAGTNNQLLVTFNEGLNGNYSWNMNVTSSTDGGSTWSTPQLLFDGATNDAWDLKPLVVTSGNVLLTWTAATNTTDYDSYIKYTVVPSAFSTNVEIDTQHVSGFKFGALALSSAQRSKLLAWAQQIPEEYEVKVYAPNFVKPDLKHKALRSAARAAYVAKLLQGAGVKASVVRGKQVKAISPQQGRNVVLRAVEIVG